MSLITISQNPTIDKKQRSFFYEYQVGNVKAELFFPILCYHSYSNDSSTEQLMYKPFTSNGELWYNIRISLLAIDGCEVKLYSRKYNKFYTTYRYISAPAKYFKDVKDWKLGESPFKFVCMIELYLSEKDESRSNMPQKVFVGENKGKTMFSCVRPMIAPTPEDENDLLAEAEHRLARCKQHYNAERDRVEPKEVSADNVSF